MVIELRTPGITPARGYIEQHSFGQAPRKDKTTLGNAVDAGIAPGTWYTVRFEVIGTSLKAYVKGVLEDSETDGSLTSGGIALSTVNATADFDDVKVTLP